MKIKPTIYVFGTRGFPNIIGGVEQHCESLYQRLAPNCEITVLRRKPFVKDKSQFQGIKFIDLNCPKKQGLEAFIHSLLCSIICLFKRPDIVHIHNIGPGIFTPLLRLFGLKVIITYHSPNYEHKKWSMIGKYVLKLGEFLSLRFANKVIFVNKYQLKKLGSYKKFIHVNNGVQTIKTNRCEYLNDIGVEPKQYILAVGRFSEEKGLHILIEAYKKSGLKDIRLVLVGDADHHNNYSRKIIDDATKNNIVLTGFIKGEKLAQVFSNALLFVIPSLNEGLPIALLEAMSYNLNILASDIPPNKEICLDNNNYFMTTNSDDLCSKMLLKIQNQHTDSYSSKIEKFYNWDIISKKVLKIYKSTIRHRLAKML